jgi:hypothetical protein
MDQAAAVRAAVLALPPMDDEQIAAVCEVIATSRDRWRRRDATDTSLTRAANARP